MDIAHLPLAVDAAVKYTVVLGGTFAAAVFLRRASAATRHLAWTLGLAGTLLVPALSFGLPRWEVPLVRLATDESATVPAAATPPVLVHGPHATDDRAQVTAAPAQALPVVTSSPSQASRAASFAIDLGSISWTTLLLIVWAAGAAIVLGRVLLGLAAVEWMSRRTPLVVDAPWSAQASALASSLGLARVRFLRSSTATMPMAWGICRPSILMPADADAWPADRLRIVLLHELAHVKRRDCATHVFAQIACAVYWFNPLAWMAARRLRSERERACDDLVLSAGTRGSDYANELLEVARVMRAGRFPAVLAGATLAMAHRSQLEGRLIAILDPTLSRHGLSRLRAAAGTAAFVLLLVPVASLQPWVDEPETLHAAAVKSFSQVVPAPQPAPAPHVMQHEAEKATAMEQAHSTVHTSTAETASSAIASSVAASVAESVAEPAGELAGHIADTVVDRVMDAAGVQAGEKASSTDPRRLNALIEALRDSDREVRETALSALAKIRDPRVFEPLTAALQDASPDIRQQAAFGLGQMRDARAIEPLSAALKDTNADVREQAAFALGQLRAKSAVPALAGALKDTDADVREQAVFALGQIRDVSAIDAITPALHDAAPDVREQAAFALGQIRDRRAVEPLISVLKDEKPDVREQAAFALGQLRDPRAVEALVIALKDATPDVREQAAFALGQIRDPRAIDGLTAALKDASSSVRQQAAFALGQIR
jgi:HEAT repeat protein/beta-lactamase regulating signal transducer with metallopeptidase domain